MQEGKLFFHSTGLLPCFRLIWTELNPPLRHPLPFCSGEVLAHLFILMSVFYNTSPSPNIFCPASGSEEGAVFPPVPWGVPAPGGVCLHGGHVTLPLRLHHHLHSAPQVRTSSNFTRQPLTLCAHVHLQGLRFIFEFPGVSQML